MRKTVLLLLTALALLTVGAQANETPPACVLEDVPAGLTETQIRDAALEVGCHEVDPVNGYVRVCWDEGLFGRRCACWRVIYPGGIRVMLRVPCKG